MASDKSEWELSEFGNLIETENEKYGEITQIAERRRTGEKYVKIRKIRSSHQDAYNLLLWTLRRLQGIYPGRGGATFSILSKRQAILHYI